MNIFMIKCMSLFGLGVKIYMTFILFIVNVTFDVNVSLIIKLNTSIYPLFLYKKKKNYLSKSKALSINFFIMTK